MFDRAYLLYQHKTQLLIEIIFSRACISYGLVGIEMAGIARSAVLSRSLLPTTLSKHCIEKLYCT